MVRNALKAAIGCLFVVVLLAETAIAQSTLIEGVPPQAELSERLAVIESLETEPTADQQRDQAALTAALQAYERLQAIEERQQALEQRVSQAPEQLLRLERELNGRNRPFPRRCSGLKHCVVSTIPEPRCSPTASFRPVRMPSSFSGA